MTIEKLENFVVGKPSETREVQEMRNKKPQTVIWRTVKVSFRNPGSDTVHTRTAIWEWCEFDKRQIGSRKYNGYFFIKRNGCWAVCMWFTGSKEATIIDQFPYTHKIVREAFYEYHRPTEKRARA